MNQKEVTETRDIDELVKALYSLKNGETLRIEITKCNNEVKVNENDVIVEENEDNLERRIEELNLNNCVFLPGSSTSVFDEIASARLFVLSSDYESGSDHLLHPAHSVPA